jgi:UDP-glucuronate 4-epimerase
VRAVVTGCAGFIGSTLVDALLNRGDRVLGIDSFTDYYDPSTKRANLKGAVDDPSFELAEADLRVVSVAELLEGADVIFHEAAQPGVRTSWSDGFAEYVGHNVLATQRLLEAARVARAPRVVYASSSSVYGHAPDYPTSEEQLPRPHSPYGVTKLAAEHLCNLYAEAWQVPTVSLRYFSVYGPRQRPDMAVHRIIHAGLSGALFPLFGDGRTIRDFTFVDDVVRANLAAADVDIPPGTVVNVAGGSATSVGDLIALVGEVLGVAVTVDHRPPQPGEVGRTGGSIDRIEKLLGWSPHVDLREGIEAQAAWHRSTQA